MKSKESFIFHKIWWENTRHLPTEARCEIYDTLFRYVFEGIEPTFDPLSAVSMACSFIKKHIDDDNAKYIQTCEKRAAAGRRGGLAKQANAREQAKNENSEQQTLANLANANFAKQTLANLADNDNEYEYDNDNEREENKFSLSLGKKPQAAEERRDIIFNYSLFLLSQGRPNGWKEAEEAYDYNEGFGWYKEVEKKNGDKVRQRIHNKLSYLKGRIAKMEQIYAPAHGTIMQDILKECPTTNYQSFINDFRGIQDEGNAITFLFSRRATADSFMATFKDTQNWAKFREVVIKHIKQHYPEAQTLYSKTI
ncbi:MAG: DUF6291 domain-containing protein [Paludibacteraceae bacterium]|nr:DUF6291 domain-containing protein [Paludibacteraceae bacterium]